MATKKHPKFTSDLFPAGSILNTNTYKLDRRIVTTVDVIDPNGHLVAKGASICNTRDSFDESLGKSIAVGRAAKSYYHRFVKRQVQPVAVFRD